MHHFMRRFPRHVARNSFNMYLGRCRAHATGAPEGRKLGLSGNENASPLYGKDTLHRTGPRVENGLLTIGSHGEGRVTIPGQWLRDNCSCIECRNAETAQREVNVFKRPEAGKAIKVAALPQDLAFEVTFADGHRSVITSQLINNRSDNKTARLRSGLTDAELWQANISSDPPTVEHNTLEQGSGMASLLAKVRRFGFCFIDDMPATPEASQSLLEQIGPIRNTHYGGFYDFTSDLSSKDTAYTSESLEPHTDTTYFTDPIGLQALHLLSHTDGEGGLSSLVDGFSAAARLYKEDPKSYAALRETGVYAHASGNEGISIQPAEGFPVLNHASDGGHLQQVRWNTADRAGIAAPFGPQLDRWYDAAAKFDALLGDLENQYWFQLKPGKMLLFDNWRVLHGRSAFTGKRRMCGGYINRDDFISKYRMTNLSKEDIAASTVTG